jgi:hypothetical protein
MKREGKGKRDSSSSTPTKTSVAAVLARKESLNSDADLKLNTDSGQAFLLKYFILGLIFLLGRFYSNLLNIHSWGIIKEQRKKQEKVK